MAEQVYTKLNQSGITTTHLTEFAVDRRADIAQLPTFPDIPKGSDCIVLEDSSVFMLGVDNTWHEI